MEKEYVREALEVQSRRVEELERVLRDIILHSVDPLTIESLTSFIARKTEKLFHEEPKLPNLSKGT